MKKKVLDAPAPHGIEPIPVNLTIAPVVIQPVAAVTLGATAVGTVSIMREGFITGTGFLPPSTKHTSR